MMMIETNVPDARRDDLTMQELDMRGKKSSSNEHALKNAVFAAAACCCRLGRRRCCPLSSSSSSSPYADMCTVQPQPMHLFNIIL